MNSSVALGDHIRTLIVDGGHPNRVCVQSVHSIQKTHKDTAILNIDVNSSKSRFMLLSTLDNGYPVIRPFICKSSCTATLNRFTIFSWWYSQRIEQSGAYFRKNPPLPLRPCPVQWRICTIKPQSANSYCRAWNQERRITQTLADTCGMNIRNEARGLIHHRVTPPRVARLLTSGSHIGKYKELK